MEAFDLVAWSESVELSSIPPVDLADLPTWDDVIESCPGLSLNESFEVYTLAQQHLHYPPGTLAVHAGRRLWLQPVPKAGIVINLMRQEPYYTASGVDCKQCGLSETRTMICDGVGPNNPRVLIIAEAPGREEDACGVPFVGQSGTLLRAVLGEVGFAGDDYYMTNTVRCRPPGNRDPTKAETAACRFWLEEEVRRVQPQSVLFLGKAAREAYQGLPIPPETPCEFLAHPAYLLRNPGKLPQWRRDLAAFAQSIGVFPVHADTAGQARPADGGWDHGPVDWDAPVLAVDTETRTLDETDGSDIVAIQASDGSVAQLYVPLYSVGRASGQVRLPQHQDQGEAAEGTPGSVQTKMGAVPERGRFPYLPQPEMPEPNAHRRREPRGESGPESGSGRQDREESIGGGETGPVDCRCTEQRRYLHMRAVTLDAKHDDAEWPDDPELRSSPLAGAPEVSTRRLVDTTPRTRADAGHGDRPPLREPAMRERQPSERDDALGERADDRPRNVSEAWQTDGQPGSSHQAGTDGTGPGRGDDGSGTHTTSLEVTGPPICTGAWQDRRLIYANVKYDAPRLGFDLRRLDTWEDVQLIAYCLRYPRVGLKILGPELTGISMDPITSIIGAGKKQIGFDEALARYPERAVEYALKDAVVTARLFPILYRELARTPVLHKYYREIEKPVVPVVLDMEQNGALVDNAALAALEVSIKEGAEHYKALAQFWADRDFNPNSGREIAQVVLELGGKLRDKTPTGALQTDKAALLKCLGVETESDIQESSGAIHSFVGSLLRYKGLVKLASTYCPALARQDGSGRIHTHFNQMVTDTNRFSSSGPNLQNIPARSQVGRKFRECFVARPGYVIVKADCSQLELRILAHFTKEQVLMDAYGGPEERDVHALFAAQWGVDRKTAKNGVFGLVYGVEAAKLAKTLELPASQTPGFIEDMRTKMPAIMGGWREHVGSLLDEYGYVETLYGWRNYYPGYRSPLFRDRQAALREAGNLPIQGTAGGILKRWLLAYDQWRQHDGAMGSIPILMVHDELVFEVPEKYAVTFGHRLRELAREFNPLCVPLVIEVEVGRDWGTCIPLKEYQDAH